MFFLLQKNAQEDVGETENDAAMSAEKRGTLLQAQFSISWPGKCKRKRLSKENSQNLQSSATGIIGLYTWFFLNFFPSNFVCVG